MHLKTFFRSKARKAELAGFVEATYASWGEEASYARWRQASDGVTEAYRSWVAAPSDERWLAHAAYLTALEREEDAARAYQERVEQTPTAHAGGPRW